jgi:hypothetical protein
MEIQLIIVQYDDRYFLNVPVVRVDVDLKVG